jgi:hypothetical protein
MQSAKPGHFRSTSPQLFSAPQRLALLFCAAVVTIGLLLWLPYRVAVAPRFGDSYLFGFNNRVALIIIGCFLLLVALVAPPLPAALETSPKQTALTRKTLFWVLAGILAFTGVLSLLVHRLDGLDESIYLIDRVKMALEGRVIGRDFEFAYGAFLVYAPAWIARILHLSPAAGYDVFWLLLTAAGFVMLYQVLLWVDEPGFPRRPIFLFFAAGAYISALLTGTNYTIFRYILPCFLALWIYRRFQAAQHPGAQALAILLIAPAFAAVMVTSPEIGISFGVGMALYFAIFGLLRNSANMAAYGVALLLCAGFAWWLNAHRMFETLNGFRTGGFNFPVIPGPYMLTFLCMLALCGAFTRDRLVRRQGGTLLLLIFVSIASVAGALGRCDGGHTLMNPLGIAIAGMGLAYSWRTFGRLFMLATVLVFLVAPLPGVLYRKTQELTKATLPILFAHEGPNSHSKLDEFVYARMSKTLGPEKAKEKLANLRSLSQSQNHPPVDAFFHEPEGTIFEVPFDYFPARFGSFHDAHVDSGYYYGTLNVLTPEAVGHKVAELDQHPERPLLLMGNNWNSFCEIDPVQETTFLRQMFLFPYHAAVRHPDSILHPVCAYIEANYHPVLPAVPERFGYAVWERNF